MPRPVEDIYSAEDRAKRERERLALEGIEAPDETTRALELLAGADDRARGRAAPTDTSTPVGIPPEWVAGLSPAAQEESATARRADEDRARRREATRAAAYDRGIVDGLTVDADVLDSVAEAMQQGLTFGLGDEAVGAGRSLVNGTSYTDERDRQRARQDKAQRENPMLYAASEFIGGLPAALLIPGAGPGASLTRRAVTSGVAGTGLGMLSGAGRSRGDVGTSEFFGDTAIEGALGGGMGIGSELGAAGLRRVWNGTGAPPPGTPEPGGDFTPEQRRLAEQRLDAGDPDVFDQMTTRDALEEAAATRRVRSTADSAVLSDVRRAGDYSGPGGEGYRGLARDLDATGISPRGSITRASTAQQRASRLENQAGREIGAVRDEMVASVQPDPFADASAIDDVIEPPTRAGAQRPAEQATNPGARGGRARPQRATELAGDVTDIDRAPMRQDGAHQEAPMSAAELDRYARETSAEIRQRTDPALVRYSGDIPRMDDMGRITPTPANTAARLREEAASAMRAATTPEQRAAAAQLESLARDIDQLPAEDFAAAQRRLRALDDEAAYGTRYPNAPGNTPERAARARATRGGVRADMDEAVRNTLGEEALQRYRAARGRFGAARAVGVLSERGAAREASNLQAGLGDTIAVQAGLSRGGGPAERVWNAVEGVVVNRYLRGLGHTTVAALQEFQSDAMAREIVRRLSEQPVTQPMARALAEAQRRGPRAFGVTLVTLGRQSPEVQEVATQAVQQTPDWQALGLPTAEDPIDTETEGMGVDWGALGLPTADDYEEEQR